MHPKDVSGNFQVLTRRGIWTIDSLTGKGQKLHMRELVQIVAIIENTIHEIPGIHCYMPTG